MAEILEKYTQKLIVEWMNLQGHAVFLNEISGMPDARNASGRRALRGNKYTADIIGTLKGGRAVFIECKRERYRIKALEFMVNLERSGYCKHTPSDERMYMQAEFLLWQRRAGALAFFAFNLDDVIAEIAGAG